MKGNRSRSTKIERSGGETDEEKEDSRERERERRERERERERGGAGERAEPLFYPANSHQSFVHFFHHDQSVWFEFDLNRLDQTTLTIIVWVRITGQLERRRC